MDITIRVFNQEELSNFKNAELVAIFNKFAVELNINPVKKFADNKSALRRTSNIQKTYFEEFSKQKPVVKKSPAKKKAAKDDTKIHGLDKGLQWQINLGTKTRKGTILEVIENSALDKSGGFIENLIAYIVKNAPNNPKRKPMTSAYAAEYIKWYVKKGNIELFKQRK